jgi:DNA-binding phage protein
MFIYDCNIEFKQKGGLKMLTLEQVRQKLAESNLMAVSKAAGVHSNSVYRFMSCGTRPSYELIVKLSDYIEQKEKGEKE